MGRGACIALVALLAACAEPETVTGPTVAVELYVSPERADELLLEGGPGDCYARCPMSGELPPVELVPVEACGALRAECTLRAAEDRVRITAWYAGLDLPTAAPDTAFALLVDGVEQAIESPLTRWRADDAEAHVVVYDVPDLAVPRVSLRASNGPDFGTLLGPWTVAPAKLDAQLAGCPGACPAGVGAAVLQVAAPPRFSAPVTVVTRTTDPVTGAGPDVDQGAVELALDDTGRRTGARALAVPDLPGGRWTVWAEADGVRTRVADVDLDPAPLSVEIDACAGRDACAVAAGAEVTITVSGPAGLQAETAALVGLVDGAQVGDPQIAPLADLGDARVATVRRIVPDGARWQLVVRVGRTEVRTAEVAIDP